MMCSNPPVRTITRSVPFRAPDFQAPPETTVSTSAGMATGSCATALATNAKEVVKKEAAMREMLMQPNAKSEGADAALSRTLPLD